VTANAAAAEIRGKILRKMKELDSNSAYSLNGMWSWEMLRNYIKSMAARASKKKGGLGRR